MSYSISIPNISIHNSINTRAPNSYRLYIAGYGGHVGLTPLSEEAAEYWMDLDIGQFGQHICFDDKPVHIGLNGQQLGAAYKSEFDTVAGPELHDGLKIEVYDHIDGEKIWGHEVGGDETYPFKYEYDQSYYRAVKKDISYAYFRTFDAISNIYVIDTDRPFDPALLELEFVWFSDSKILKAVRYDGRMAKFDHQCGQAVQGPIASVLTKTLH